jgi:hypothetical protein
MARSMALQAFVDDEGWTSMARNPEKLEDCWPEEPTAVDAALTMEELIVDEMKRQGALPRPANDPEKATLVR